MLSSRVRTPGRSLVGTPARVSRNLPRSKIRVVCRIRPFLPGETGDPCLSKNHGGQVGCLQVKDKLTRLETYKLDQCYGGEDHVSYLFKMELEPVLPVLFRGCNATVFAYGATGSGKTHTMQGVGEEGLIPLSMRTVLSVANAVEAVVEVSLYEIYMDRCYDLLEQNAGEVSVLEDIDGRIQLRGLSQVQVKNIDEFQAVYSKGCTNRKVGPTGLNDVSSRSHAILSVSVTTGSLDNIDKMVTGKLNLIDLAGNEDNRRSGNEGLRLAESSRINQSLFALSNVINALNANESRIPYRDSKLTRVLQDSLGGTSCSLMIACLSPGCYQEAVHTLNLAAKSKQIVNKFVDISEPPSKVDMAAKLKAWREEKNKTYGKSPAKALTPSMNERSCLNLKASETTSQRFEVFHDSFSFETPVKQRSATVAQERNEKENVAPTSPFLNTKILSPKSPLLSTKLRGLGSALREALSPLSSNTFVTTERRRDTHIPTSDAFAELFEIQTPLEKFNSASQSVQESLIKEYIEVLNKGSREELLALKGIGEKRAAYIMQLREKETSPIKELQDLHKIGLSEKLACTLFNGTIVRQLWATPK